MGTPCVHPSLLAAVLIYLTVASASVIRAQLLPPASATLPPPNAPAIPSNISCRADVQQLGLQLFYLLTNGTGWRNATGWPQNVTEVTLLLIDNLLQQQPSHAFGALDQQCFETTPQGTSIQQPSYCCWFGIACCLSREPCMGSDVVDDPARCGCELGTVTNIKLQYNSLVGPLSNVTGGNEVTTAATDVLALVACNLRRLELQHNKLSGTLPKAITLLTELETLGLGYNLLTGTFSSNLNHLPNLKEIDFTRNQLTGTVPADLCNNDEPSGITDLLISYNNLNGTLSIKRCENLIWVDAKNNAFTGDVPSLAGFDQLHIYHLGRNKLDNFSYFSDTVQDARLLMDLSLPTNRLQGRIPRDLQMNQYMYRIHMENNNLQGSIPYNLFKYLGSLTDLDLKSNNLTGAIPASIGYASALTHLDLSDNHLTGTIPQNMSLLVNMPAVVDLRGNNLHCCSGDPNAPLLPSFLAQSTSIMVPVSGHLGLNYTGLGCPALYPSGSTEDGNTLLNWGIDPQYYNHHGCQCMQGYSTEMINGVPHCYVDSDTAFYISMPWILAVIILPSLIVLLVISWLVCLRGGGGRPALYQAWINTRKRVKGEPVGGTVSIVVTDIEGYSELMKQVPEVMTEALNLHNSVIRKARWTNFGYTIEQEGDSYSLVFYEAMDAVMFCLQVQQHLVSIQWPEGLFPGSETSQGPGKKSNHGSQMLAHITAGISAGFHAGSQVFANSWLSKGLSSGKSKSHMMLPGKVEAAPGSSSASRPPHISSPVPSLFNGLRIRMGVVTGRLPEGCQAAGSSLMDMAKVVSDAGNGGQIMLDGETFRSIRHRRKELGAVDKDGLNYAKLNKIKPPWYLCWRPSQQFIKGEAILLDMGQYVYSPTIGNTLPVTAVLMPQASGSPATSPFKSPQDRPAVAATAPAVALAVTGATMVCPGPVAVKSLKLYQVLPQALAGRAKVFGNKLALKSDWAMLDRPYFTSPGTMEAPLGAAADPVPLPPVTLAVCGIERADLFAARARRELRSALHSTCVGVIQQTLRSIPGGYLCLQEEAELKYTLVFPTPEAAVAWSLGFQEALMYADWPEAADKSPLLGSLEKDHLGNLLFRGPRMKIGLCEGTPKGILPNLSGRAQYHGASIHQAARYMECAAHGGQVVCEEQLALKVLAALEAAQPPEPERSSGTVSTLLPTPLSPAAPTEAAPATRVSHSGFGAQSQPTAARLTSVLEEDEPLGKRAGQQLRAAAGPGPCNSIHTKAMSAPALSASNSMKASSNAHLGSKLQPSSQSSEPPCGGGGAAVRLSADGSQTSSQHTVHATAGGMGSKNRGSSASLASLHSNDSNVYPFITPPSLLMQRAPIDTVLAGEMSNSSVTSTERPAHVDSMQTNGSNPAAGAAATKSAPLAVKIPNTSDMPLHRMYHNTMVVLRMGSLRVRGIPELVHMVQVTSASLVQRIFPPSMPSARVDHVTKASGQVGSAPIQLPEATLCYKEHWVLSHSRKQEQQAPSPGRIGRMNSLMVRSRSFFKGTRPELSSFARRGGSSSGNAGTLTAAAAAATAAVAIELSGGYPPVSEAS